MINNKPKPTKKGLVVAISGKNTIAVQVEVRIKHFTGKVIKSNSTFLVHDEKESAKLNDYVSIIEGRKVSKRKTWHLDKIITSEGVK